MDSDEQSTDECPRRELWWAIYCSLGRFYECFFSSWVPPARATTNNFSLGRFCDCCVFFVSAPGASCNELFNHLTFEFTLSNMVSDSDSESEMSVEYLGSNSDCRQPQNCTTGDVEIEETSSITLTQQAAVSSLLSYTYKITYCIFN